MDITCIEESETSPPAVFELPGEPAIVINGVPPLPPNNDTLVPCDIASDTNPHRTKGFGEWLKGREIRKLFGDQFYSGKVTDFDREAGWYRVVYEDGDGEDLEWHELQEVLLPLDIMVPLKALALKIVRKRQRPSHRYKPRNPRARQEGGGNGKTTMVIEEDPLAKLSSSLKTDGESATGRLTDISSTRIADHNIVFESRIWEEKRKEKGKEKN